jgi:uncharacterized protein (TIGR03435 family)
MLAFIAVISAQAQPTITREIPRSFEVVSIKRNEVGGESRRAGTSPGGLYTASNASLKLLISRAYGVAEAQIEGGPNWIDTDTFDISARAATPLHLSREEVRPALQAMLADRFHLVIHHEAKQGAVLSLTVAKSGPKFKEHVGPGLPGIGAATDSGRASITGTNITIAALAEYLSGQAGRPVLDNTSLKGAYDLRVDWANDQAANPSEPSVFAAMQEQLGLKLTATRGPIDTIIIDRADRPSAN